MARKRYNFWLDEKNAGDWALNDLIARLKKPAQGPGQFTRAIREGLRLWASLRDHQTDVLLELFPWVRESLAKSAAASDGGGHSELAKEIAAQIVLMGGNNGYLMQSAATPPATGKLLGGKVPALPVFNDDPDEPTVLIRASASTDSSLNFVSAMRGMQ